jgi:hypothetical protein
VHGPDAAEWQAAIQEEFRAHLKSETWEIQDRSDNRRLIGSRTVFRTKYKSDGTIERRKARLVAKGYTQVPGLDFDETYAPVVRFSSIRAMVATAAEYKLDVHQMDVTAAYLNGEVSETLFMEVPEGLKEALQSIAKEKCELSGKAEQWLRNLGNGVDKVCRVRKALYGLKQSGRQWFKKLDHELKRLGLNPTDADPCVYVLRIGDKLVIVSIYVDDILIASNCHEWMDHVKSSLSYMFEMKDLGPIHYCLGVEFHQDPETKRIRISQPMYAETVLRRFGMGDCKPILTPTDPNSKLTKPDQDIEGASSSVNFPYQSLVGSLMYLATCTRPDLAYCVSMLSQFNTCYQKPHVEAAKRALRYLQKTKLLGLSYGGGSNVLIGYVDADWAGNSVDRRSYTGYAFCLGGAAISWEARKQRTVALSSTEAEYMALSDGAKEAIYLGRLLQDIRQVKCDAPTTLFNDNQGSHKLAKNPVFHARTKHIDIRHHFVREALEEGHIDVQYMATEEMPADVLTKGLFGPAHVKCSGKLGLA